jgi:sulfur-carrier protein
LKIDFCPKLFKNLSSRKEIPGDPMKTEIKLFANFREYLPPGSEKYSCWLDLEEGTTVGEALERLKIPLSIPMIALVNGLHRTSEDRLQPGDVLSIFPPVAGG